jgi:eukaryotic-like serine/threonine-protein kinase
MLFIVLLNLYLALAGAAVRVEGQPPSLAKPLKQAWSYSSDEMLDFQPAASGQHLYVPLAGGKIVSVRTTDGSFDWKTEAGGVLSAAPAADERGVYVATEVSPDSRSKNAKSRGFLRLLSPESGIPVWVRSLELPVRGSLTLSDGTLYAASRDGRLYAFEAQTGEIKWVRRLQAPLQTSPLAAAGSLLLCDEAGLVSAIDRTTGQPLWSYQTRPPLRPLPVLRDGILFVGASDNVLALDSNSGKLLWRARPSGGVQGLASSSDGIVATTLDNFVYKYSVAEGKRVWKSRLPGRVTARPLVTPEGVLLSPLSGGEVIILSPETGRKINSIEIEEDSNSSAAPLLWGDLLLLSTRRGIFAYTN